MAVIVNSKTPKEIILSLFNEILSMYQTDPVTLDEVNISAPEIRNASLESNTKVYITNNPSQQPPKLKRQVEMIYTRISIPEIYRRKTETLSNPQTETIFSVNESNWDEYTDEVFKQEILDLLKLHPDAVEIEIVSDSNNKQAEIRPKEDQANWIYIGQVEISLTKE